MNWKIIIWINIIISLIISLLISLRGLLIQGKDDLTCVFTDLTPCPLPDWLIEVLIIFIVVFIIIIIIISIIKSKTGIGGFKMPKIKKHKIKLPKIKKDEKLPEFGKDINLDGIEKKPFKKIKI